MSDFFKPLRKQSLVVPCSSGQPEPGPAPKKACNILLQTRYFHVCQSRDDIYTADMIRIFDDDVRNLAQAGPRTSADSRLPVR